MSVSDYYPFGMQIPGRVSETSKYRYGFNGQEKSDDLTGNGNSYTTEFWKYDARIGRRWNVDPVVMRWESPYMINGNNLVVFMDTLGSFKRKFQAQWYKLWHGGKVGRKSKNASSHPGGWFVTKKINFEERADFSTFKCFEIWVDLSHLHPVQGKPVFLS